MCKIDPFSSDIYFIYVSQVQRPVLLQGYFHSWVKKFKFCYEGAICDCIDLALQL